MTTLTVVLLTIAACWATLALGVAVVFVAAIRMGRRRPEPTHLDAYQPDTQPEPNGAHT